MKNSYSNIFTFNKNILKKSIKNLNNGNIVGLPTETVYGLGGNAYSKKSIEKIFKLKGRLRSNPLIVHYFNLKDASKDVIVNERFKKLYTRFCPGPITFVLKKKFNSKINRLSTANLSTVAIRFPKHKVMRALLKEINYPLAAPSANLSTRVSAVTHNDVKDDFGNKIKYILEGGTSSIGLESTIIDIINQPKILRLGGLKISEIQKILRKKIKIENNPKKISTPGQYKLHYSPGIPIKLNVKKANNDEAFLLIKKQKNNQSNHYYLTKDNNLNEAAKNLYSTLRQIKKDKYKYIVVQKIPNIGLGRTINDRLLRASKF